MKDANAMYRRLFSLAFKRYGCDRDTAHDVAADAICAMMETGTDDFNFGFTVVKNNILIARRNAKRRQTYQFPIDEEGEPMELKIAAVIADADLRLVATECANAIEALPDGTREVMRLTAMDFSSDEVAHDLKLPLSEVYWRKNLGRKILRQRDGYELSQKRGHKKYIGIRKDHHKWCAAFRRGEDYYHLGYFGSAAEAAKAYDAKAKEVLGEKATLNFPDDH